MSMKALIILNGRSTRAGGNVIVSTYQVISRGHSLRVVTTINRALLADVLAARARRQERLVLGISSAALNRVLADAEAIQEAGTGCGAEGTKGADFQ